MSRRQLPTLRGVYDGNDRYVRRSSEKVSYKTKAQPRYRRRYVTRGKKKKSGIVSMKEEENETRLLKKETNVSSRICGGGGVGRLSQRGVVVARDGGTVVAVAEQRGVTWGYTTWGPGPDGPPSGEGESVPRI